MFTAQNVGGCFDSSGGQCAFTVYCAYHGAANSGAIYANMPYVGHVGGCDEGQYPNGNDADATLNVTSHEHNEAITDPQLNAWYDAQGNENGDKCAWTFGTVSGPSGAEYNQTINGRHYFLQREWSNANPSNTCVQTYSIGGGGGGGGGGGAPTISSFSPMIGHRRRDRHPHGHALHRDDQGHAPGRQRDLHRQLGHEDHDERPEHRPHGLRQVGR